MFKSVALIAALLACVAITPAQATSVENGLCVNGISLNGVKTNGADLDVAEAVRLIAIELPPE